MFPSLNVPAGSTCRGGDVTVYVLDQKTPELALSFYSVHVFVSVLMAFSILFYSINSPDNSLLSHSVLLILFCLIGPLNYIYLSESLLQP